MKRLKSTAVLLISIMLIFSSCSRQESAEAERSVVRMAVTADPDGLDPHATASASTFQVTSNIYETLVTVDEGGNIIPMLAESWEVSDDGLYIRFNLRSDVHFSNGKSCDSEAVKASFERLMAPGSIRGGDYSDIAEIEVIDSTTIGFAFDSLNVTALSLFAYPWSAVVDASVENLRTEPVGSGPYMLSSWVPQQDLELKRNPYYDGECNIDTVKFIMMPDMTTQVVSLQNGQVDIILITGDLVSRFEGNEDYQIMALPINGLQLMAMNNANGALSDERVRVAICSAVDKDALIESVWWGYGQEIGSHFPVVLSEYVDMNNLYPYDTEKARALLEEAGYGDGLVLNMRLPRSYQEYVNAGLVIADQLKAIGITVNVEIVEWAEWLSDVYTGKNYDLTVVGHTGRLDASSLLSRYRSGTAENYFNFADEEFDLLLDQYSSEPNEKERVAIAHRMQEILAEKVPALYIQDPIQIYVMPSTLKGFKIYPINIFTMNELYFD